MAIDIQGKQNLLFLKGSLIKWFVIYKTMGQTGGKTIPVPVITLLTNKVSECTRQC